MPSTACFGRALARRTGDPFPAIRPWPGIRRLTNFDLAAIARPGLLLLVDLLGEVVAFADFGHHMKLGFEPVDMVLFVDENLFE